MTNFIRDGVVYGPPINHINGSPCPFPDEIGLLEWDNLWEDDPVKFEKFYWQGVNFPVTRYRLRLDHPFYTVMEYNVRNPEKDHMVYYDHVKWDEKRPDDYAGGLVLVRRGTTTTAVSPEDSGWERGYAGNPDNLAHLDIIGYVPDPMKKKDPYEDRFGSVITHDDSGICPFPKEIGLAAFGKNCWQVSDPEPLGNWIWEDKGVTHYRLRADHPYYTLLDYNEKNPTKTMTWYDHDKWSGKAPDDCIMAQKVLWADGSLSRGTATTQSWGREWGDMNVIGYRKKKVDNRPICSADGCSRREPCGPFCRDNGNFDKKSDPDLLDNRISVRNLTADDRYNLACRLSNRQHTSHFDDILDAINEVLGEAKE